MSESNSIKCLGCEKQCKSTTILKHLSHKPDCYGKYTQIEIDAFKQKSNLTSKALEKAWKKNDYLKNKSTYSIKRAEQYWKKRMKSVEEVLQRQYERFQKKRGKDLNEIERKNLNQEERDKVLKINEMVSICYNQLTEKIGIAVDNCMNSDYSKLVEQVINDWEELEAKVDEILTTFGAIFEKKTSSTPSEIEYERIKCNSCSKTYQENTFLKHLAKSKECKMKYEGSKELESFKTKAAAKEKRRLQERYQKEKEDRSNEYKAQKEYSENYENCKKAHGSLIPTCDGHYSKAIKVIDEWPTKDSYRGEQCRREILKFKAKDIPDITQLMIKVESMIDDKISNLKIEVQEVANDVKQLIGHWDFDGTEQWKKELESDFELMNDMLENGAKLHVEKEMEDLYASVIHILRDTAIKIGDEILPTFLDKEFYWVYLGRENGGMKKVPINVYSKNMLRYEF